MVDLVGSNLKFSFPGVHKEAEFNLSFVRTLRIPDDGKAYPLPPGLATFPMELVDAHKDRVPEDWAKKGGVMLPMYQSEAMWIRLKAFTTIRRPSAYPMLIRVAAGKVNAVNGERWTVSVTEGSYCVAPTQKWLDGFCVEKGKIKQFVAMPLGWGLTVEKQITGEEAVGGLQIEVIPMKSDEYEKRFPKIVPKPIRDIRRSDVLYSHELFLGESRSRQCKGIGPAASMGLGAGGTMNQEIYSDPYGLDVWDISSRQRVFVHLTNSFAWEAITQKPAPKTPCTVGMYKMYNYRWFDHYIEGMPVVEGMAQKIRSVMELGFQKGMDVLPTNESVEIDPSEVVRYGDKRPNVRDGDW